MAKRGSIVVLMEHTDGSSSLARFFDGSVVEYNRDVLALFEKDEEQYRDARRKQTTVRAQNISAAVGMLLQINSSGRSSMAFVDTASTDVRDSILDAFQGKLRLHKIAVGGHSFGGAAAITYALRRGR